MPRQQKFEREELLDRAIRVFWSLGYEAASVQALGSGMQIHPGTLYHLFGDKHGLFLEALERYEKTVGDHFASFLEADGADLKTIRLFFETTAEMLASDTGRNGCLLTNVAVERGLCDPDVARCVARYFQRIEQAFENALRNAQQAGQITPQSSVERRASAHHLSSVLQGYAGVGEGRSQRRSFAGNGSRCTDLSALLKRQNSRLTSSK